MISVIISHLCSSKKANNELPKARERTPLQSVLLLCHTKTMDAQCFRKLLYVGLGHGLWQGCYMTICRTNESSVTLETLNLKDEARLEKSIPATLLQSALYYCYATPRQS